MIYLLVIFWFIVYKLQELFMLLWKCVWGLVRLPCWFGKWYGKEFKKDPAGSIEVTLWVVSLITLPLVYGLTKYFWFFGVARENDMENNVLLGFFLVIIIILVCWILQKIWTNWIKPPYKKYIKPVIVSNWKKACKTAGL